MGVAASEVKASAKSRPLPVTRDLTLADALRPERTKALARASLQTTFPVGSRSSTRVAIEPEADILPSISSPYR